MASEVLKCIVLLYIMVLAFGYGRSHQFDTNMYLGTEREGIRKMERGFINPKQIGLLKNGYLNYSDNKPRKPALSGDDNIGMAVDGNKPIPEVYTPMINKPRKPALSGDDNIGVAVDGNKPIPGVYRPMINKPRKPALSGDDNIGVAVDGNKPIPGVYTRKEHQY